MTNRNRHTCSLFFVLLIAVVSLSCSQESKRWNLLIVTLDTTRADRIGCYGRNNASTPVIDSLAKDGVLFERCYSANPITTPSHSTIMTGTYPMYHGVRDNGLFTLPAERTTLAEILKANGWATAAAVGSFPLTGQFGLNQGFDFFEDEVETPYQNFRGDRIITRQKLFFDERPAGEVNQAIIPWLEANADRPFFVWVHYFDPHQPFLPPTPFDELFAADPYQGEIAYADEALGRILAVLEEMKVADRTVVVVVGDHGEGLGEHDELTHSLLCYETTIRVPLIMSIPGHEGGVRVDRVVGTVDIVPTILDLMNLPNREEVQGKSLRPFIDRNADLSPALDEMYYAETLSPRLAYGWSEVRTLIDGQIKYIHSSKPELYDLRNDPNELHNLAADQPELVESMKMQLEEFVSGRSSRVARDAAGEVDADTMQRLAALGYISALQAPSHVGTEEIFAEGVAPRDRAGDVSQWSIAKDFVFKKKFLEAREISQELVDADPTNQLYLALLAYSQFNLGHVDQALATLERSTSMIPHAADLYLGIAGALEARNEVDRAVRLVESVVSSIPSTEGFYTLAGMYKGLGDQESCKSALAAALELDSTFAPARVALAVEAARAGDLVSAEAELNQALSDGPLYPPAHFNLGKVYLDTGRASDAVGCFERSRSLSRNYWNAYLGLVAAYVELGDYAGSAGIIDELVKRQAPGSIIEQAEAFVEVE